MSEDGTGLVFCSSAKPSVCCVVMTAMHEPTSGARQRRKEQARCASHQPEVDAAREQGENEELRDTEYSGVECAEAISLKGKRVARRGGESAVQPCV